MKLTSKPRLIMSKGISEYLAVHCTEPMQTLRRKRNLPCRIIKLYASKKSDQNSRNHFLTFCTIRVCPKKVFEMNTIRKMKANTPATHQPIVAKLIEKFGKECSPRDGDTRNKSGIAIENSTISSIGAIDIMETDSPTVNFLRDSSVALIGPAPIAVGDMAAPSSERSVTLNTSLKPIFFSSVSLSHVFNRNAFPNHGTKLTRIVSRKSPKENSERSAALNDSVKSSEKVRFIATPTGRSRKIFRNRLVLLFESDLVMIQLRFFCHYFNKLQL